MRFFRLRFPDVSRVVLVESGSRHLSESVIPRLRDYFGSEVPIDLVTCYAGLPTGLREDSSTVFHIHNYRDREGRRRLYRELLDSQPSVLVIICSGEPIMTKWKWALAFRLPVKLLIVNENGDFFWCDRSNWRVIRRFILVRAGLSGGDAVRTIGQILIFPLTLSYLLLYATGIHLRRKLSR
ncbi:MAG: hypothetical protein EHM65_08490 [Acidobacteriales bacterium]|nr:MAG: hypothetical protein EHM65_08490 [Terriglobales bacterium]